MLAPMRSIKIMSLYETDDQESTTDLDSHADTCVVGKNALIILDFETPV